MALFAIGDFHLSIVSSRKIGIFRKRTHYELYKPMDVFDPVWKNHVDKLEVAFQKMVSPSDTVVITGDHSWGINLAECKVDLDYIAALPGRKILTRGNHDLFWDTKKTEQLNSLYEGRLSFLQNNFYSYEDYALVGSKGICNEKMPYERYTHLLEKEMQCLHASFEAAYGAGYRKFILFLHYPPTSIGEKESSFIRLAKEYGVKQIIYSHCHGKKRYYESYHGLVDGIEYHLVSSDFLRFKPKLILP